jgi:hypothetical protein
LRVEVKVIEMLVDVERTRALGSALRIRNVAVRAENACETVDACELLTGAGVVGVVRGARENIVGLATSMLNVTEEESSSDYRMALVLFFPWGAKHIACCGEEDLRLEPAPVALSIGAL